VRKAFSRNHDETTHHDGFHKHIRERMKKKEAWPAVWEAAMCVIKRFKLVVLVCNHGKHRSLSMA